MDIQTALYALGVREDTLTPSREKFTRSGWLCSSPWHTDARAS